VPIVLKSGSLNLLEPSGPVQACNGIALPLHYLQGCLKIKSGQHATCGPRNGSLIWVYVTDYKYLFGYVTSYLHQLAVHKVTFILSALVRVFGMVNL